MNRQILRLTFAALFLTAPLAGCNKEAAPPAMTSKLTKANYDQIHEGMTKAQAEAILGTPNTVDTKDFVVMKKTVYRYTEGTVYVNLTFKNDELEQKDSNLGTQ